MAWYAKFDGVDGSAKHKDHKKWINVASCNIGGHKAGGGGTGVGRVGGKMHLEDVSLGIISDKATPKLLEARRQGQGVQEGRDPRHGHLRRRRRADLPGRSSWRTCRSRPTSSACSTTTPRPTT